MEAEAMVEADTEASKPTATMKRVLSFAPLISATVEVAEHVAAAAVEKTYSRVAAAAAVEVTAAVVAVTQCWQRPIDGF